MKKNIIIVLSFLTCSFAIGQTKSECIEYIKTAERVLNDKYWIKTDMINHNLILVNYDKTSDFKIVTKEELDMSKVQSVAIKMYEDYFQIYLYFTGDYHNVKKYEGMDNYNKDNAKFGYGFKNNWINIY